MQKLFEGGFGIGDLEFVLQPELHVDEYDSRLGPNDKNIVLTFILTDKTAASDLVDFIEKGYDIIDADSGISDLDPCEYLVFVEMSRRRRAIAQIFKILSDLTAASGFSLDDWRFQYMKDDLIALTPENLKAKIPLSPKSYRETYIIPLEKLKADSGVPLTSSAKKEPDDIKAIKHSAGLL